MKNKTVFITGATDGIGKQTAIDLAKKGASIILHGRSEDRLISTQKELKQQIDISGIDIMLADLSSLMQVKIMGDEIVSKFKRIDVLINNAGIYNKNKKITVDGFENTFAVNHLSHFILTGSLIDAIKNSPDGRIINVSSVAHTRAQLDFDNLNSEKTFDAYNSYAVSKLANILFTYELSRRLEGTNITVNALHPGVIGTKLLWEGFKMRGAAISEGVETSVYLASSEDVKGVTSKYFVKKKDTSSSGISYNEEYQKRMWEISERMIKGVIGDHGG